MHIAQHLQTHDKTEVTAQLTAWVTSKLVAYKENKPHTHNMTSLSVWSLSQICYPDQSLGFPQFLATKINSIQ
jgi:hypothetical protein